MALPASDNFNRGAGEDPLSNGGFWLNPDGLASSRLFISGGANFARGVGGATVGFMLDGVNTYTASQYAAVTSLATLGASFVNGVVVRGQTGLASQNGYIGVGVGGGGYAIQKAVAGVYTTVVSGGTYADGYRIQLNVDATTNLELFVNGFSVLTGSDAAWPSGSAGIVCYSGAGTGLDDWGADNLAAATTRRFLLVRN